MKSNTSLFDEVLGFRPYHSSSSLTKAERWIQQISRWLMFIAAGLFGLVLLMALGKVLFGQLPDWLTLLVLLMLVLDLLAAYLMLISDAVVAVLQVVSRKIRQHHDRSSYAHDLSLADRITTYPEVEVRQVDIWLGARVDGMERRMALILGRGFAIFGLVGFLASDSLQKSVMAAAEFLAPTFKTTPEHMVAGGVVALILLLIGAVGARVRASWCRYVRYLIQLSRLRPQAATAQSPEYAVRAAVKKALEGSGR